MWFVKVAMYELRKYFLYSASLGVDLPDMKFENWLQCLGIFQFHYHPYYSLHVDDPLP